MKTFLDICQSVRAQAGISGKGPSSVENQIGIMADVVRWTTESYNEIQTMHENWNFLHNSYNFELKGGTDRYNPIDLVGSAGGVGVRTPTKDTFVIQNIKGGEKERLIYTPWSVWQISDEVLKGKIGRPTNYTEDPSGTYRFYPVEEYNADPVASIDYIISFEGYARPDIMVGNYDVPVLSAQYDELIKLGALLRYAEYYNSQEVYQTANIAYKAQMKMMEFSELPRDNLFTIPLVAWA